MKWSMVREKMKLTPTLSSFLPLSYSLQPRYPSDYSPLLESPLDLLRGGAILSSFLSSWSVSGREGKRKRGATESGRALFFLPPRTFHRPSSPLWPETPA